MHISRLVFRFRIGAQFSLPLRVSLQQRIHAQKMVFIIDRKMYDPHRPIFLLRRQTKTRQRIQCNQHLSLQYLRQML